MLHLQTLVSALVPMSLLPYVSALSHPYVSAVHLNAYSRSLKMH